MDTTVKAPAGGPRCTNVRVWHALPTYKSWCQAPSPYGTLDQHSLPAGIVEAEKDERTHLVSTHTFWNVKAGQLPNVETHYISDFRVISPERRFDQSSSRISWNDVLRYNSENKVTFPGPCAEIAQLAEKLKNNHSPSETIVEASKWIKDNLTYDASAIIESNDARTILSHGRGHCLHFATVFIAFCNAAGLQCRSIQGLNLRFPSGNYDGEQSRNDYTNGHVWAEVFLPDVGWIEVEPGGGEKCFVIPATYIQNNTSFQNYAVWVTEQGAAPRPPRWVLSGNGKKYVNDYGLDNKITFTESRR
jgi:transglutaminase-like putative cysteine protease